jgi:hypothetical protein
MVCVEKPMRIAISAPRINVKSEPKVRVRASQVFPITILAGLAFGSYFVLRYLGLWTEQDTQVFVRVVTRMLEAGRLAYSGNYIHGFAYPVWAVTLSSLTGIAVADLSQLYLPLVGNLFLSVFGFTTFCRLLASIRLGMLATALLFLVPELVFTVSRGNHEKLTVSLTLLALLALLNSFREIYTQQRWRVFAGWVAVYYLTAYTLVSINALFGSSFIVASTLAMVFLFLLILLRPLERNLLTPVSKRLLLTVGTSWLLVTLVMFYIYPQAGSNLNLLSTALERISALFLSFTPESDPYMVSQTDWASPAAFHLVSSFRWVLFGVSFVTWLFLLRQVFTQISRVSLQQLLLVALYGAFGFQVALAIPVDLIGLAAGSNLQVRMYTYFALLAAPMLAVGLNSFSTWLRPGLIKEIIIAGIGLLLIGFVFMSFIKSTLDPAVSNRWLFYRYSEVAATRFWDTRHQYQSLWVDVEGRLRYAYTMHYPEGTANDNVFNAYRLNPQSAHALRSPIIRESAIAWRMPPPVFWLENRPYDNGETQIFHRIPRTPFQR